MCGCKIGLHIAKNITRHINNRTMGQSGLTDTYLTNVYLYKQKNKGICLYKSRDSAMFRYIKKL